MIDEIRHPHPHIDPRQPRNAARPRTNPPVFAWKPGEADAPFELKVARDEALSDVVLQVDGLADPMLLPETAFEPGSYHWAWSAGGDRSPVFSFVIDADAVTLEVPSADEWLARLSGGHPRIYVSEDKLGELRASIDGSRAEQWAELRAVADSLLAEAHEIEEPPFLPNRAEDYEAFFSTWAPILWESRAFVKGAEILALAWLASGDERYARAACERMASISRWDPEGSSYLGHNDEAHMSVIWHGAKVVDWTWDRFTEDERALVIEQFRRRGEITFEHMHDRGTYGVTRFDSHAGREIVFLALLGMVFHEHIPEARVWLEWLRPVLCGIWPVWGQDDGSWAEGPSYGLAYVNIMTMLATALKRGCGVDLYRRPFWRGHARWREAILPPYADWIGFGDHTERWRGTWLTNASLVERIDRETGEMEMAGYVAQLRAEAEQMDERPQASVPRFSAQDYLAEPVEVTAPRRESGRVLRVFPDAGWAAFRTDLSDADRDIALVFRSSPFGSISHSHASNNDFFVHVAGRCMMMPSGYYAGYGSSHHAHWIWHTKSHNCPTLSGAGQIMRSHDSVGSTDLPFEDERIAYLRGTADASYADRAERCRRHVVYLKAHAAFLMIDEFVARPGIVSALEWNAHSWDEFVVDEEARSFRLEREGSVVEGHFLHHHNSFFSLSEGFDPPPGTSKASDQWRNQHHLRFTPTGLVLHSTVGVVLSCGRPDLDPAEVRTERVGDTEIARIGDDLLAVNMGGGIAVEMIESHALAALVIGGIRYDITDDGVTIAGSAS
ncbi:MAG: DUF4962 domain-containing protein [Armatimonadota bacterium]|jgi:hypothetical protein